MVTEVTFRFETVHPDPEAGSGIAGLGRRKAGVFRIFDLNDNLILLDRTHDLAQRLERFYAESPQERSLDLRRITGRVEFCRTDSPFEALYLLDRERRRWFPDTHSEMKTFRRFHLLKINRRQRFPRIYGTRRLKTGVEYFGPFPTRSELDRIRACLERTFRLRPCSYNIRGDDPYPECIYFQTRACSRPCNGDITRSAYMNDVDAAIAFVTGNEDEVARLLFRRMETLAMETNFEEAEVIRRRLERIRRARLEHPQTYRNLARFDFVVLLRARSAKVRKLCVVRSGRIVGFEQHSVGEIQNTVLASLEGDREVRVENDDERRYAEFCIVSTFLLKPVASVRLIPLGSPEETARIVADAV